MKKILFTILAAGCITACNSNRQQSVEVPEDTTSQEPESVATDTVYLDETEDEDSGNCEEMYIKYFGAFKESFTSLESSLKPKVEQARNDDSTFHFVSCNQNMIVFRTIEHNGFIYYLALMEWPCQNLASNRIMAYLKYKRNGDHYDLVKSVPRNTLRITSGMGLNLMNVMPIDNKKELLLMFNSWGGDETVQSVSPYSVLTLDGTILYEGLWTGDYDGCDDCNPVEPPHIVQYTYQFDPKHTVNGYPDMSVSIHETVYVETTVGDSTFFGDSIITNANEKYKYDPTEREYKQTE